MLSIDGSRGEGGGQVLRTTLALCAIVGQEVEILHIRRRRSQPGLRPQHLAAVKALAEICDAEIQGAEKGSIHLIFKPGKIKAGKYKFDIGTAGSISLFLQTIMPVLAFAPAQVEIEVKGGTDVPWSPPIDYVSHVLLPMLFKIGYSAQLEVIQRGFYPVGGGKVKLTVDPSTRFNPLVLEEPGKWKKIEGKSYASQSLKEALVAERQAKGTRTNIWNKWQITPTIKTEYAQTACPGSGIVLWVETENAIIGASALGKRGKRAEVVGGEALDDLSQQEGLAIDEHLGDQLIPYLALVDGESKYKTRLTGHALTNLEIVKEVLGVQAHYFGLEGEPGIISITGKLAEHVLTKHSQKIEGPVIEL